MSADPILPSKEWSNSTAVATAFGIGTKESVSVSNLQTRVSPDIVDQLRVATRSRGIRHWITHDMISRDMFNLAWSSGASGVFSPWVVELTNREDDLLATRGSLC